MTTWGGGAKQNGQPGIVDTFLNFHIAMHNVSTPRLSKKKSYAIYTRETNYKYMFNS